MKCYYHDQPDPINWLCSHRDFVVFHLLVSFPQGLPLVSICGDITSPPCPQMVSSLPHHPCPLHFLVHNQCGVKYPAFSWLPCIILGKRRVSFSILKCSCTLGDFTNETSQGRLKKAKVRGKNAELSPQEDLYCQAKFHDSSSRLRVDFI